MVYTRDYNLDQALLVLNQTPRSHFASTSQSDFRGNYLEDKVYQFTPRRSLSAIAQEKRRQLEERERQIQQEIAVQQLRAREAQEQAEQEQRISRASSVRDTQSEPPTSRPTVDPYRNKTSAEKVRIRKEIDETRGQIMRYRAEQRNRQVGRQQQILKELDRREPYDPFGKPGAGAPLQNRDNKKKKFTEAELHQGHPVSQMPTVGKGFADGFGQPGAGAPRRTDSGRPITQIQGDGSIRFGQKENRERYRQDNNSIRSYADVLENQIKEKKWNEQMRREDEQFREREMLKFDNFGKPGAGAPLRTASGKLRVGRSLKDETALQKIDSNSQNARFTETSTNNGLADYSPRARNRPYFEDVQIYDPFGKGGAGAPLRDSNGKLITARSKNVASFSSDVNSADIRRRKRAANEYLQEQKYLLEEKANQKNWTQKFDKDFSGREFASLMKESTVGHPRRDPKTGKIIGEKLRSSDITQSTVQPKHYSSNANSRDYYDELTRDAEERSRRRQLEKLREKQEDAQHGAAFNEFWGKAGGGAPRDPLNKKVNLEKALHTPRAQSEQMSYNKAGYEPMSKSTDFSTKPKFVKTTIKSSSSNNFEVSPDHRTNINYRPSLPYASFEA